MPLVINTLRGGQTHTNMYAHPHKINFKKPGITDLASMLLILKIPKTCSCMHHDFADKAIIFFNKPGTQLLQAVYVRSMYTAS